MLMYYNSVRHLLNNASMTQVCPGLPTEAIKTPHFFLRAVVV